MSSILADMAASSWCLGRFLSLIVCTVDSWWWSASLRSAELTRLKSSTSRKEGIIPNAYNLYIEDGISFFSSSSEK